eukprot:TRINITY_DN3329_c0_g2_i2.p1 TRINITY_DN3329_c0_g2~~TRINITY_DN3329_c0_g2_i2.p1  ORF type:complete len:349 (+),score=80.48 TRINITY_DN3329_c0_g2_i2:307-1353(+)
MLSKLYVEYKDQRPEDAKEWLKLAKLGAEFLRDHGKDAGGNFYFSLTRSGKPITHPFNIFSDCFATIAFGAYYAATHDEWALNLALATFDNIEVRKSNPKGQYNKCVGETRSFSPLNVPMIDLNLCLELADLVPDRKEQFLERAKRDVNFIETTFFDYENKLLREGIPSPESDGDASDTFEGRVLNPGHIMECLWFLMTAAERFGNKELIDKCADFMVSTLEYGWDKEFGGLFYFMDRLGKPPQQLEWDQKLWWVHLESLYACLYAFHLTKKDVFADWYNKLHDYTWSKFHDKQHGEFFGYLNRRGEVLLQLKGGKWKGFFHVPRALLLCTFLKRSKRVNSYRNKFGG